MSDFTFAQAAAILGITPSAFSYRARTVKGVPFAQGPRYNERRVSLEVLERISGRVFTTREIEYALTIKAPNWKRSAVPNSGGGSDARS